MVYIRFWGKEKINSYIFKVGSQTASAVNPETGEITTEDRWFCEVNIYDNCYEILFNYFTDENRTEFYSQGLQFYLNDDAKTSIDSSLNENYYRKQDIYSLLGDYIPDSEVTFYYNNNKKLAVKDVYGKQKTETVTKSEYTLFGLTIGAEYEQYDYCYNVLSDKKYRGLTVSNYASANNYEDTLFSSNPLNENSAFFIEMDGETYLMKMRGSDYNFLSKNEDFLMLRTRERTYRESNWLETITTQHYDDISYYRSCDVYYLAEVIYNSCKSLKSSSSGVVISFEFGDLFNYFYDSNQIVADENICNKVKNYLKSYYQIKVNKHAGKITSSSQSLFNMINGTTNYDKESSEEAESNSEIFSDYHHGRTVIDINENYFCREVLNGNELYLTIDPEFKKQYKDASGYRLRVIINLDNINYKNTHFAGLAKGTLKDFEIYQVLTISTSTGETVITDITQEVL
ncbi:hypothetical protein IKA92_01970 [bacterium]|nr:hypothetical protein [bacterium]